MSEHNLAVFFHVIITGMGIATHLVVILNSIGSNFTLKGKVLRWTVNEPFASIIENERLLKMVEPERFELSSKTHASKRLRV